jgi:hypothetical protein
MYLVRHSEMFSSCLWVQVLTFFNVFYFFYGPPKLFAVPFINFTSEGVTTILSFALIVQHSFQCKKVCNTNKPFTSIYSRYFSTSLAQPACFLPAYQPVAFLIITHPLCDDVTWGALYLPILVCSFPPTPGITKHFRVRSAWIPSRPPASLTMLWTNRNSVPGLLRPCIFVIF